MAPHPDRALTPVRINAIKKPGRYTDGNGLYLVVDPSGAKRWLLRTVVLGRRCDIGLGGYRLVTLAEARERARRYRLIARDGGDPLAEKRKARRVVPTFAEAAKAVHAEHQASWKNNKHRDQWISTLTQYAFPALGTRRVDQIETPDILRALAPIWLTRSETARRVRQRIRTVLDWAKASGFRDGANPVEGVAKALPRQPERQKHFAALAYTEVPKFVEQLSRCAVSEPTRLAFEFLILTATRTGEVIGARWSEIDLESRIWTIPAARMKAGVEHRAPLAPRAIEILKQARAIAADDDEYLFPGRSPARPLSNMVFLMALRRMGLGITAHGFRSAFRDWASERTSVVSDVCEAALAHAVKDQTEAAYRRSDLFKKRIDLMARWAQFVAEPSAKVIRLKSA